MKSVMTYAVKTHEEIAKIKQILRSDEINVLRSIIADYTAQKLGDNVTYPISSNG